MDILKGWDGLNQKSLPWGRGWYEYFWNHKIQPVIIIVCNSLVSFLRNAELTEQTRNLLRKPSFDNW